MSGADDRRAALERGAIAEWAVAGALERAGWSVLARNWRGAGGEIDVIARRGGVLRFVEVKARAPGDDTGADAITDRKIARLVRAAEAWLQEDTAPRDEVAFLVAVVSFRTDGSVSIDWLDDAFDG